MKSLVGRAIAIPVQVAGYIPDPAEDYIQVQEAEPTRDRVAVFTVAPGGGLYTGPDGGLYAGPGGGLYTGPGGGLYTGPGGGLYASPGGGLYAGPGGGLYTGPSDEPYRNNWPPRKVFLKCLLDRGLEKVYRQLKKAWGL